MTVGDQKQLVSIYTKVAGDTRSLPVSYPNFEDLRKAGRSLEGLAAYAPIEVSFGEEQPEVVFGELVSTGFFRVLGVPLERGRGFLEEEERELGASQVVVLSEELWRKKLGGQEDILGSKVWINGSPFQVVGVAGRSFQGTNKVVESHVWFPLGAQREVFAWSQYIPARDWQIFRVVGRRAHHATTDQVADEYGALFNGLVEQFPIQNESQQLEVVPFARTVLGVNQQRKLERVGWLLAALVGLILALSAATVVSLLIQDSLDRRQEMSIHLTLGAAASRLLRARWLEVFSLSALGGLLGLGISVAGRELLWRLRPAGLDGLSLSRVDLSMVGVCALTAALFGLIGLITVSSRRAAIDLASLVQGDRVRGQGGARVGAVRRGLVSFQVLLAVLALSATLFMVRNLIHAYQVAPGFEPEGLVYASLWLPDGDTLSRAEPQELKDLQQALMDRPAVQSVAFANSRPLKDLNLVRGVRFEGFEGRSPQEEPLYSVLTVSPEYFETLGIPLVEGRPFATADGVDTPQVAVINEGLASRVWPDGTAVGKAFAFVEAPTTTFQVVGVARDVRHESLTEDLQHHIYLSATQTPLSRLSVFLRGAPGAPSGTLVQELRASLDRLVPGTALVEPLFAPEVVREARAFERHGTFLMTILAVAALALTGVAIFSLISHVVYVRRAELGIRLALGAPRGRVLALVARTIAWATVLGLILGVAVNRWLLVELSGWSYSPKFFWLATASSVAIVILLCALATSMPFLRHFKSEPSHILREAP